MEAQDANQNIIGKHQTSLSGNQKMQVQRCFWGCIKFFQKGNNQKGLLFQCIDEVIEWSWVVMDGHGK